MFWLFKCFFFLAIGDLYCTQYLFTSKISVQERTKKKCGGWREAFDWIKSMVYPFQMDKNIHQTQIKLQ